LFLGIAREFHRTSRGHKSGLGDQDYEKKALQLINKKNDCTPKLLPERYIYLILSNFPCSEMYIPTSSISRGKKMKYQYYLGIVAKQLARAVVLKPGVATSDLKISVLVSAKISVSVHVSVSVYFTLSVLAEMLVQK
jgi:hypothetical protein